MRLFRERVCPSRPFAKLDNAIREHTVNLQDCVLWDLWYTGGGGVPSEVRPTYRISVIRANHGTVDQPQHPRFHTIRADVPASLPCVPKARRGKSGPRRRPSRPARYLHPFPTISRQRQIHQRLRLVPEFRRRLRNPTREGPRGSASFEPEEEQGRGADDEEGTQVEWQGIGREGQEESEESREGS
jgi:hypothetical protein